MQYNLILLYNINGNIEFYNVSFAITTMPQMCRQGNQWYIGIYFLLLRVKPLVQCQEDVYTERFFLQSYKIPRNKPSRYFFSFFNIKFDHLFRNDDPFVYFRFVWNKHFSLRVHLLVPTKQTLTGSSGAQCCLDLPDPGPLSSEIRPAIPTSSR